MKLQELRAMMAVNKLEKVKYLKFLLSQLWQGNTTIAIEYLSHQVIAKNQDNLQQLIADLGKHFSEIINYSRRSRTDKTIRSGRMEKVVNLTVGSRQKNKGISWRPNGSREP